MNEQVKSMSIPDVAFMLHYVATHSGMSFARAQEQLACALDAWAECDPAHYAQSAAALKSELAPICESTKNN